MGCYGGDLQVRKGEGVVPQLKIGVGIKSMKKLTKRGKTDGGVAWRGSAPVDSGQCEDVHELRLARGILQDLLTRGKSW
jgi:hypothetical protein